MSASRTCRLVRWLGRLCLVAALPCGFPAAAADTIPSGDLVSLLAAARAAGEGSPDLAPISLVEATSRHLLRTEGDIDFPLSIGIDLPLDARPRELGALLSETPATTGRFVVVFDVALAKAARKVRDTKDRASRRIAGVNKTDNPAYLRAAKLYSSSSTKLERAPGNAKLLKLMEENQQKLSTTPRYLEQPIYGDYTFKLAAIEGVKTLTVNYRVIDRIAGRVVSGVFDVVENEAFTVAYGVDTSDPNQGTYRSDFVSEKQVKDWERAPVVVPLSQVLDRAAAAGPGQPLGSLAELLAQISAERNRAIARADAEDYDARPLNDPRFDSVVAIYTGAGSMGSGFYVRPNIVMTNWHVVENHPIVELRTYDKRESFGQVIAKDVRLDLALVKVQDRGRPVRFYQGKDLVPGETLEAIGHPRRLLFSITRGVVSAIRKRRGGTNETQTGDVLYIQTDADINPGNSGGPLFKGDKVVGVNVSSALRPSPSDDSVMVPAPGLNFAVHYAEAPRFLDQSMRGE